MATSAQSAMGTIEQFIARVGQTKAAEEAHTEAGGYEGETEHPVKNVDDRTEVAQEGERSEENTSDVKEEQGGASVDSTPEASSKVGHVVNRFARGKKAGDNPFTRNVNAPRGRQKRAEGGAVSQEGSAADDSEESPLNPQPTGQTPDLETASAEAGKDDPGSDHPARTDNDALDGHKYANADPIKLAGDLKAVGDNLLAQLSWVYEQLGDTKSAGAARQTAQNGGARQTKQASAGGRIDPNIQAQLGWEMAGLINGTMDKAAADQMVENAVGEVIQGALGDAVKVAYYFDHYFGTIDAAQKQAEGELPPGGDPLAAAGGGGIPPGMGGGGGGEEGGPMAGGGGGGGGEDGMLAALGGGDPAGGGGDPAMAGGGGEEGGPMGGGGGEGGGEAGDIDVQQLVQILDALGVTPDEIAQAQQEEAGGGLGEEGGPAGGGGDLGGGGLGGAGGEPKAARDKRGAAKTGNHHSAMRDTVMEILQRSRRK